MTTPPPEQNPYYPPPGQGQGGQYPTPGRPGAQPGHQGQPYRGQSGPYQGQAGPYQGQPGPYQGQPGPYQGQYQGPQGAPSGSGSPWGSPPPSPPRNNRTALIVIASLVAVVVLVGGLLVVLTRRESDSTATAAASSTLRASPTATSPTTGATSNPSPTTTTPPPTAGQISVDINVGDCVQLSGTDDAAKVEPATCGSADANYKVNAKVGEKAQCVQDTDSTYYETGFLGSGERGALCLDVDWEPGQCWDVTNGSTDPKKTACAVTDPAKRVVKVVKILQNTSNDKDCENIGYSYDQRQFVVCLDDVRAS